jgi:hypothetical protein
LIRRLRKDGDLREEARKLLSFTDNRQDASLQAGHFNDFVEITCCVLPCIELFTKQVKAASPMNS